jgi:LPPG:FO 2-phospho-L-lactate transferase
MSDSGLPTRITVLSGGVGGARFLQGVLRLVPRTATPTGAPTSVTVVANTADDIWVHGLKVCPDLDTVMYTLGNGIDTERGWGRLEETWHAKEELAAYGVEPTWFGLGDLFYHYNALRGRSKGEGASAFERALAIDPEDGQSRLHLLELRVWEGNATKVDSLLPGLDEGSDFAAKWPFVQALIVGDTSVERRVAAEFRQLNDRALVRVVIHSASTFPSNLPAATVNSRKCFVAGSRSTGINP